MVDYIDVATIVGKSRELISILSSAVRLDLSLTVKYNLEGSGSWGKMGIHGCFPPQGGILGEMAYVQGA